MSDFLEIYDKDRIEEMYKQREFPNEKKELLKEYFTAFADFY